MIRKGRDEGKGISNKGDGVETTTYFLVRRI
jgi:hypothetical protein